MRKQKGIKIELQKKIHRRICVRVITFLTTHPLSYVTFCWFLRLLSSLPKRRTCWMAPIKIHNTAMGGNSVWWYREWTVENTKISRISCSLILAKNVIYFRLCFSFSCSRFDLILIKNSHTLNSYSFLQKFLLKAKTYKILLLITLVLQFTAKITNSEKATYFLSLMSSSISKLKSHLLFICKNISI